jgi:catechol 2,3-dioxygenase-like lactoylglutathione lyase family enzyme
MAGGVRLFSAVVVVRDLARSEAFYRELLDLRVDVTTAEAVLLSAESGDHLVLRALSRAPHVSAAIGVLFVVWRVESADELDRVEGVLRRHDTYVSRSVEDGWDVLEGRDPDASRVVVVFRVDPDVPRESLPARIYQY